MSRGLWVHVHVDSNGLHPQTNGKSSSVSRQMAVLASVWNARTRVSAVFTAEPVEPSVHDFLVQETCAANGANVQCVDGERHGVNQRLDLVLSLPHQGHSLH